MHNTVFQITTSPVSTDDYISEADFIEHWFFGSIADSIDSDIDREEEIGFLQASLEKKGIARFNGDGSFELLHNGKEIYFAEAFEKFSKSVKEATSLSFNEFVYKEAGAHLVYNIKDSFCREFDDYVSSDEFDTIPFDEFMRVAEYGKKYYIGGVLDYRW